MAIAKLDDGVRLSNLLGRHENEVTVEPRAVALQMTRGEKSMVAKEIRDVAWDIVMRSSARQTDHGHYAARSAKSEIVS